MRTPPRPCDTGRRVSVARCRTNVLRPFLVCAVLLLAPSPAAAQAQSSVEMAMNGMGRCQRENYAQVEIAACYAAEAQQWTKRVRRALEDEAPGRRLDDAHWRAILADCRKMAAGGAGSGQGIRELRCEILALAARLDLMLIAPGAYR